MVLLLVVTALPYLIGRFWGRRRRERGLPALRGSGWIAFVAAAPSYYFATLVYDWYYAWGSVVPMLCTFYSAAGLSFIAGARSGFAEDERVISQLGFVWAIGSLLLVAAGEWCTPLALAVGLALSSLGDMGATKEGLVPAGWNRAQMIFSVLLLPTTLFAAFIGSV